STTTPSMVALRNHLCSCPRACSTSGSSGMTATEDDRSACGGERLRRPHSGASSPRCDDACAPCSCRRRRAATHGGPLGADQDALLERRRPEPGVLLEELRREIADLEAEDPERAAERRVDADVEAELGGRRDEAEIAVRLR